MRVSRLLLHSASTFRPSSKLRVGDLSVAQQRSPARLDLGASDATPAVRAPGAPLRSSTDGTYKSNHPGANAAQAVAPDSNCSRVTLIHTRWGDEVSAEAAARPERCHSLSILTHKYFLCCVRGKRGPGSGGPHFLHSCLPVRLSAEMPDLVKAVTNRKVSLTQVYLPQVMQFEALHVSKFH